MDLPGDQRVKAFLSQASGLAFFFVVYSGAFLYVYRDGYHRSGYEYSVAIPTLYAGWFFGPWVGIAVSWVCVTLTMGLVVLVGGTPDPMLAGLGGLAASLVGFTAGKMGQWNRRLRSLVESEKNTRRQLAAEKRRAEEANRARSQFLANMSHEIRTPMNVILGAGEMLEREVPAGPHREYLRRLRSAGQSLLALIDDVFDISRMEAGRLDLKNVVFDLAELIQSLLDTLGPAAEQKGLDFSLTIAPGLPSRRRGDSTRIRQVMLNLIGNALKFTESGFVRVFVEPADSARIVSLRVVDSGIGIAEDDQASIFEAFTQVDTSATRRFGGTGLGLALCHRLVELMGGTIALRSAPGQGSEFNVRIPLPLPAPVDDSPVAHRARPAQKRRLLLVEDNPDNRFLIQAFLKNSRFELEFAENGAEGLERFRERDFDLILMDLQMPVMDGYEALREIRALHATEGRALPPIIAVTASVLPEERERCLQAGFDAHLPKPVDRATLIKILEDYLKESR